MTPPFVPELATCREMRSFFSLARNALWNSFFQIKIPGDYRRPSWKCTAGRVQRVIIGHGAGCLHVRLLPLPCPGCCSAFQGKPGLRYPELASGNAGRNEEWRLPFSPTDIAQKARFAKLKPQIMEMGSNGGCNTIIVLLDGLRRKNLRVLLKCCKHKSLRRHQSKKVLCFN